MATVQEVITRAGQKIGVNDMTATELQRGLDAFNEMVSGWRLHGVDIWRSDADDGRINVEAPSPPFALTSQFPMPDAFREGAIYMLAQRLAPEFSIAFDADEYLRRMQAHYYRAPKVEFDDVLTWHRTRLRTWL